MCQKRLTVTFVPQRFFFTRSLSLPYLLILSSHPAHISCTASLATLNLSFIILFLKSNFYIQKKNTFQDLNCRIQVKNDIKWYITSIYEAKQNDVHQPHSISMFVEMKGWMWCVDGWGFTFTGPSSGGRGFCLIRKEGVKRRWEGASSVLCPGQRIGGASISLSCSTWLISWSSWTSTLTNEV